MVHVVIVLLPIITNLRFNRGVVHVGLVGYIVYHYCLRFDRGVVNVVVVILSSITVYGLTDEWLK